jgi:hypothetical protein
MAIPALASLYAGHGADSPERRVLSGQEETFLQAGGHKFETYCAHHWFPDLYSIGKRLAKSLSALGFFVVAVAVFVISS